MNKTFNINLGGYPFVIDDDAYQLLTSYLQTIHKHFSASESYKEITNDIETRLAELLQERLATRTIVMKDDINGVINVMGRPEEFGAEPMADIPNNSGNSSSDTSQKREYRTGKRLFRDSENKVLGGVCSGIAAFFGVGDPLWVRLLFALLFWTGFPFVIYFIFWIIIPKAQSAADRLAMRGEPINVSNIAKTVEEEVSNISEAFRNPNGGDKNRTYGAQSTRGAGKVVTDGMFFASELGNGFFKTLGIVIRPLFGVFGAIIIFTLGIMWFSLMAVMYYSVPFSDYLFGSSSWGYAWVVLSLLILFLIPLFWLIWSITRIFFKTQQLSPKIRAGVLAIWVLNALGLAFMGVHFGQQFGQRSYVSQDVPLDSITSDTLEVVFEKSKYQNSNFRFFDSVLDDEGLATPIIDLSIDKASGKNFELTQKFSANGVNTQEAYDLAKSINYPLRIEGNKLILAGDLIIPKGTKWRAQTMDLKLNIPVGKYIKMSERTHRYIGRFNTGRHRNYHYDYGDSDKTQVWLMSDNGVLVNPSAEKDANFSQKFDNQDFNKIEIEGDVTPIFKYGAKYSVVIKGDKDDVRDIKLRQSGDMLTIKAQSDDYDEPVIVEITLPKVSSIELKDTKDVSFEGLKADQLDIVAKGDFKIKGTLEAKSLRVKLTETDLDLLGNADDLNIRLKDNANFDASRFKVETCRVDAESGCDADIYASKEVKIINPDGNVKVDGDAKVIKDKEE